MSSLRIPAFFIGCVRSSEVALETLIDSTHIELRGIMTLRSSNFNADFTDLTGIAASANVPVYFAENINEKALVTLLSELGVEVIFVIGWSKLLGASVLKVPSHGAIGYHPAALPRNRGRHPLIWALALGLQETASTFFLMEEEADAGPILNQRALLIAAEDDAASLYKKALEAIPCQLSEITEDLARNDLVARQQMHEQATHWRKRGPSDGIIDWRMPASGIFNLVRALTKPYIGAEFRVEDQTVKLWKCEVFEQKVARDIEPGKVLSVKSYGTVIKAGEGAIRLLQTGKMPLLREGDYL